MSLIVSFVSVGTMCSLSGCFTLVASACAAANNMPSVMCVACASSVPRRSAGNTCTLLTWLG